MEYKITITKREENPKYDFEQVKKYADRMYGTRDFDPATMEEYIECNALVVNLTEEEFKAIKKAVLEDNK